MTPTLAFMLLELFVFKGGKDSKTWCVQITA